MQTSTTRKTDKFWSREADNWMCNALSYDWIRGDMKYSSVVSCRDGVPLKRHWFDKPNKCWWGLIINRGIDDSVWWPWARSYWTGSMWIINEEIPNWSVRLSLFLSDTRLAFQWDDRRQRQSANNTLTTTLLQNWPHHCLPTRWRIRFESTWPAHDKKKCLLNQWMSRDSSENTVGKWNKRSMGYKQKA